MFYIAVQIELLELSRVMDQVARGESTASVSFLVVKSGAGCTIGDFLCWLKTASEGISPTVSKLHVPMAPHHQIIELRCVGHGLVRLTMTSLEGAHALLRTARHSVDIATRFQIQAHFDEEMVVVEGPEQHPSGSSQSRSTTARHSRKLAVEDDGEWVRVSREEVIGAAMGEGAWDDDAPSSGDIWRRGAADTAPSVTPTQPSHSESSAEQSARYDKWSCAFQRAVGKDQPPPLPVAPTAAVGESLITGVANQEARGSKSRKPSERRHQVVAEAIDNNTINSFNALLLDDDEEDEPKEIL